MKRQAALWGGVASIINLRHDFIAKIQCVTGNARLGGVDPQPHESRRPGRFAVRFTQFGNLVELSLRGFLVGLTKEDPFNEQNRQAEPAAPAPRIRCVAEFRVVDVAGPLAAEVLLSEEVGCAERLGMGAVLRRENLSDQRQRPLVAAPRLLAAGGVASDRERPATRAEIT